MPGLSGPPEAPRKQGGRDAELFRRDLYVALRLAFFANHIRDAELGDRAELRVVAQAPRESGWRVTEELGGAVDSFIYFKKYDGNPNKGEVADTANPTGGSAAIPRGRNRVKKKAAR